MSRWSTVQMDKISTLPKGPGVFVVYEGKDIKYIGKGIDLKKRVFHYFKKNYKNRLDRTKCHIKISLSKFPTDWLVREFLLTLRLSPPLNKTHCTWKEFRQLRDRGNGYLELPREFSIDPAAAWMVILRGDGVNTDYGTNLKIANYLNRCQTKKRWTPIAVKNLLAKHDRMEADKQCSTN